jgi:uncharacterized protein (TIGR03663 family)
MYKSTQSLYYKSLMNNEKSPWLQKPIHPALPAITNEIVIFAGIIILAFVTRFYNLGARVMSHDESLHTYFSWLLYRGQGYQHTPMMHGPWQFHLIALSYFLFGPSDFTARIPAALFSIATISMCWYWRRYLGKTGGLVAGLLMLISPFMLFYGRYVREDSYAVFSGVLMLYAVLRYVEKGERRYLYLVSGALLIHFLDKETSFIYAAQLLLFLGVYFIARITRQPWEGKYNTYRAFIIALALVALFVSVGVGLSLVNHQTQTLSSAQTAAPANPTGATSPTNALNQSKSPAFIFYGLAGISLLAAVVIMLTGYGWANLLKERSFDLMVLIGSFVLPMLIPFPIKLLEKQLNVAIPTDAASVNALDPRSILIISIFVVVFFVIAITIGMLWNREYWKYAAFFWGGFTIFYTTIFTNAPGFFTGLIGSLGYWLVQQGVERGSQPLYYYLLVQIPMYEFLPAIGTIAAIILGIRKLSKQNQTSAEADTESLAETEAQVTPKDPMFGIFFGLMSWWSIATIIALTIAGERMPWLTFHMAWPMILMTGWVVGQLIEAVMPRLTEYNLQRTLLSMLVLIVFALAAFNMIRSMDGATPPFQGTGLAQLQATSAFLLPLITTILSGVLMAYLMKDDLASLGFVALFILTLITFGASIIDGATLAMHSATVGLDPASLSPDRTKFFLAAIALLASIIGLIVIARLPRTSAFVGLFTLTIFGLLTLQTVRTSFRASYINYNNATEYLVYAHGAGDIKVVMSQVEEISRRTAGGLNAIVAYDASAPDTGVSWPMVWYLRNFTAQRSFDQPTRSLREAVAVIVDQKNFDKIEAALGGGFYRFDYIRMWWPNQDYFNLDKTRVLNAIADPNLREGIFDIWFNRDYTKYAQTIGSSSMTLTTWQPADQMRLYVRKDVASKIWDYGVGPSEAPTTTDPYEAGTVSLAADQIFSSDRYSPPGLNAPRSIAVGLNDDLYVADSRNHRILHIASDGSLLNQWGSFADILAGEAPIGTFNEPWGVAVGPDGSVYVTDTWNHRVQKFTKDGRPIKSWGQYGQPSLENAASSSFLWGPRGIAVDAQGRVFVADTGNKRIVIFDKDGNYITEFGTGGFDPGQFDEPVGIAIAPSGTVYVTDTWNQRIQAFIPNATGDFYVPTIQWDVNGWFGQSLDNKPFIAVGANEHVFVTDPEGYRVIEFTSSGEFVRAWGAFGSGPEEIGLAAGIAIDKLGFIWVTDAGNNRILRYRLP